MTKESKKDIQDRINLLKEKLENEDLNPYEERATKFHIEKWTKKLQEEDADPIDPETDSNQT